MTYTAYPDYVVEKNGTWPHWSPDGSRLALMQHGAIAWLDVHTGTTSAVPGSKGLLDARWAGNDHLIASTFSAPGYVVNWIATPDHKSVDYVAGGAQAMLYRVRIADRNIGLITSLKGVRRAVGPTGNTEISVAPDGSPVFTRDIGTQEIYAISVKWP